MSKPLFLALEEQLEIEKLQDLEIQANKTSEYEVLYDNLKNQQETQENKDANEPVEDEPTSDSSEESTEEPSLESLRNLTIDLEDYNDEHWNNPSPSIGSRILTAMKALGSLGIEYGPTLIKKAYKGVIYTFGAIGQLLMTSTDALVKYIERRTKSFDNLKSSITSLEKTLSLIKDKQIEDGQTFNDQKIINSLKIGSSLDFVANIKVLQRFTNTTFNSLYTQVTHEVSLLKHLITISNFGIRTMPVPDLSVKPLNSSFRLEQLEGFTVDDEYIQSYIYNERLPSDVVAIAYIPKEGLETRSDFTIAYNRSKLFLGLDTSNFKAYDNIDYMTPTELTEFLKELKALCTLCINQQKLYTDLLLVKKNLKFGFKSYFTRIIDEDRKITVKESLVDVVYLKALFIDKVYLSGSIDMHDYCAKTISLGLSFVEAHVKRLS